MEAPFEIAVTADEHETRIRVCGEIDMGTCGQLRDALDANNAATTIVDLSGVTFMDSSGLAVLVRAHQHITENGGQLSLQHTPKAVRRVVQIAGLDDWLDPRPERP